ncbi:GTP-binding protein 10 isoform X2 [Oratosquilla oratoria]
MRTKGSKFLDVVRLKVKGGAGGMGLPRHGGFGGTGGQVFVQAKKGLNLYDVVQKNPTKVWSATGGGNSHQFRLYGEPGTDNIIPAPVGTIVHSEEGMVLGELNNEGDQVVVAKGGAGGCSQNQFNGQKGQAQTVKLELKLIADVGFVGFPNAGKSTLLSALSRAKPKIASYPFTTLKPQLGVMKYKDFRTITLADLPGLVEGAWANIGMGHKFLRHVERTKLLLFVVDIHGFRLGPKYPFRPAIENVILLNRELELYKEKLVERPSVLVVNKMDLPNSEKKLEELMEGMVNYKSYCQGLPEEMQPKQLIQFDDIIPCSAKMNKESVNCVKECIREVLDINHSLDIERKQVELPRYKIQKKLEDTSKQLL